MPALFPRQYYYDDNCGYNNNGDYYCNNSAWHNWVRWLVLAIVIVGFLLLFILCSCLTARRRRRAGRQPYYGTGWAAGKPGQYNQTAQPYYNNQPAPPYSAQPPQHNTYGGGANQDYYGQQQGVELQSPQAAYTRGTEDNAYAPPAGPPPGKH